MHGQLEEEIKHLRNRFGRSKMDVNRSKAELERTQPGWCD